MGRLRLPFAKATSAKPGLLLWAIPKKARMALPATAPAATKIQPVN